MKSIEMFIFRDKFMSELIDMWVKYDLFCEETFFTEIYVHFSGIEAYENWLATVRDGPIKELLGKKLVNCIMCEEKQINVKMNIFCKYRVRKR